MALSVGMLISDVANAPDGPVPDVAVCPGIADEAKA